MARLCALGFVMTNVNLIFAQDENELDLLGLMNAEVQVVTASRKIQNLTKAPAVMHIIFEDEIRARGYQDLKDIFRDVPGFDISEELAGEVRTLAIARGLLGANKLMVLQNGRRLNPITGERLLMGNNMPIRNAQRIEVMYGPGSVLYGADAYAGVVNIITRNADDLARDGKHFLANFSYGTENEIDASLFASHFIDKNIGAEFQFRWFQTDGFDPIHHPDFEGYTLNTIEQPGQNYNARGRIYIGDFEISFRHANAREAGGQSTLPSLYNYSDEYIWHEILTKIYAQHNYSGHNWTLVSTISFEYFEIGQKTNFVYAPASGIGSQYKFGENESVYLEEQLFVDITKSLHIMAGFYAESVNAFPKGNNLSEPYSRDNLVDTIIYPDHPDLLPQYRNQEIQFGVHPYRTLSLYGEAAYEFFDRLTINAGIRIDYNTNYHWVATPRLGAILVPHQDLVVKVLYGHAYIRPSRYLAFEHWSAGEFGYQPNPDLKPEILRTLQAMISQTLGLFKLELDLYYNSVDDLIRSRNGTPWNQNINRGAFETFGGELKANFNWKGLKAYAYYSYLNAKQFNNNPMNKVASHKLSFGSQYILGFISLSLKARWSDRITILVGDGSEVDTLNGHFIVDSSLRALNLIDFLDIFISIRNLTNTTYSTAGPFGESPEGWLGRSAPQPGINGEVGFRISY